MAAANSAQSHRLAVPASRRQNCFQTLRAPARPKVKGVRVSWHSLGGAQHLPSTATAATVKDEIRDDVEYPLAQKFWDGETMRCLGASTRSKKILIVSVQVYSVAAYVEADRCAKELGVRERGGFFSNDDDYCSALLDGAFNKALLVRLVRDVEGPMFAQALNDTLVARMTLAGEMDKLNEFKSLFDSKKLVNGTEIVMLCSVVGDLDILITNPGESRDYEHLKPEKRISSISLSRGLFEVFMGGNSVIPPARKVWAAGARQLLESENVKRASRKQA